MFINNISVNTNDVNFKKNQQKNNRASDVTFRGSDESMHLNPRAAAALLALLAIPGTASGCSNGAPQATQPTLPTPPGVT